MTTEATSIEAPGGGLLRLALRLDAAVTGASGLAYLALAGPLEDLFGVPAGFLRAVGAFLVAFAVAVVVVSRTLHPVGVVAVIAANVLWVVDSIAFAAFGWHDPDAAGTVWTLLQAVVVAGFAGLQLAGRKDV